MSRLLGYAMLDYETNAWGRCRKECAILARDHENLLCSSSYRFRNAAIGVSAMHQERKRQSRKRKSRTESHAVKRMLDLAKRPPGRLGDVTSFGEAIVPSDVAMRPRPSPWHDDSCTLFHNISSTRLSGTAYLTILMYRHESPWAAIQAWRRMGMTWRK